MQGTGRGSSTHLKMALEEGSRTECQKRLDDQASPHPMSKKWVPHKNIEGLTLYKHENVTNVQCTGGEIMVSQLFRGTPEQAIAALTHPKSSITCIGPLKRRQVTSRTQHSQVRGGCKDACRNLSSCPLSGVQYAR
jgi:hypothetical protein